MGVGDHHRREKDGGCEGNHPPASILVDTEIEESILIQSAPTVPVEEDDDHDATADTATITTTTTRNIRRANRYLSDVASESDYIWIQQGYSPLQEGGQTIISSMDTTFVFASSTGDESESVLAVGPTNDDLGLADGVNQDLDERSSTTSSNDDRFVIPHFRSVAENALNILEQEYQNAVGQNLYPPDEEERCDANQAETESCTGSVQDPHSHETSAESNNGDSLINVQEYSFATFECQQNQVVQQYPFPKERTLPEIDLDAVRRAVVAIDSRDNKLRTSYYEWLRKQHVPPPLHSIVPPGPLSAFRKNTRKANHATANLSRSATIAEALRILDLLRANDNTNRSAHYTLRIHVVGCDHVECESPEQLRTIFAPVTRWIGAYVEAPESLEWEIIGPNVPKAATLWGSLNLVPKSTTSPPPADARMKSAVLRCHCDVYKDWLQLGGANCRPADLVIAFNAGIWGYPDWRTSIEYLIQLKQSIPFVATAYTLQEAEDDCEVIQHVIESAASTETAPSRSVCVWEPTLNPFSSRLDRETICGVEARPYRENAAWQGWRL